MTVYDAWQRLGRWELRLDPKTTPNSIREGVDHWDHVVIVAGGVPVPETLGDGLLSQALWAGPVRQRRVSEDEVLFAGPGMAVWLGDEDGKGQLYEEAVTFTSEPFEDVVAALLPDAVTAGSIEAVGTDLSLEVQYLDPRRAIDYVCGIAGAYWRVNPDGTLDAGTKAHLGLAVTPTTVIVPRRLTTSGADPSGWVIAGGGDTDVDHADYTTRVLLLGRDDPAAEAIVTGAADAASVPYLDLHGNAVVRTRIVNESITSSGNAAARAQLQLNRFAAGRRQVVLRADEYDLGDRGWRPGDTVWVFDPAAGLYDPDTTVEFRGRRITPVELTVQAVSWPIIDGLRVLWRAGDGTWTDLTPYVLWESGETAVEVGELPRTLTAPDGITVRLFETDTTTPNAPGGLAVTGAQYQPADGSTRAKLSATWTAPTNTDGSAVVDGGYYELRYTRDGGTTYQYQRVPWGTLAADLLDLPPGLTYDVSIRAVDRSENASSWSAAIEGVTPTDPDAPGKPSDPSASASELRIQVTHDLTLDAGGPLPDDLDHLEVHVGASSGFTADASTLAGKLPANAAMIALGISAIGTVNRSTAATCYVRVVAVDKTGNASPQSDAVAAAANLIDTANIANAAITTALIGDAQITTAKIADAQITNAKITALDAGKITTGTLDAARIAAGSIDASKITAGTITADRIVAGTITTTQIASSTITGGNIATGTIGTTNIADAAITNAKIASLAADKITTGTLSASTAITVASGGYIQSAGYTTGSGFRLNGNGTGEFTGQIQTANFGGANAVRISGGAVEIRTVYDEVDLIAGNPGVLYISGGTYAGEIGSQSGGFGILSFDQVEIRATSTLHYAAASGATWMLFPDSAFVSANVHINSGGGGNLFRATSSRANKRGEIVLDRGLALERVRALRPTSFQSVLPHDIERYGPDHRANGFIAEDLAAISPTLVHYERPKREVRETRLVPADGTGREPRVEREVVRWEEDPDAEPIPTVPNTMALLAELVAAVQELDSRVAAVVQGGR